VAFFESPRGPGDGGEDVVSMAVDGGAQPAVVIF
jgi:hypothetical protein